MVAAIIKAKEAGDSVGGVVQMEVSGLPAGLGDPVFGKLDARLAQAFFSLGAVKGMEIGAGFAAARMEGSENNDNMTDAGMLTNHAGGILGGISTGEKIILRLAIKPTPSISQEQQTCNNEGKNVTVKTEGRHDPCIVPRVVPVTESMAALVILDLWNIQERLRGKEILQ